MSVLKQKILDRTVTLGVVGLGYVGLPLAVEKAKAGFHVIGFDAVSYTHLDVYKRQGIETAELCRGLVRHVRPSAVIAIDALAAFESERICTTVQITDTGIEPGSGVGNHRLGLTEETLGVKAVSYTHL